jgi:lipopolysaccharide biosynthesis glycosyltransferase
MIHVAFCIHDDSGRYIQHTVVSIVSIFINTKEQVTVHLIHDDTLGKENKEYIDSIAVKYKQRIQYYMVDGDFFENLSFQLQYAKQRKSFSVGTLFRLKIAEILSIDKVIYLDSDLIVNMDLNILWSKNIEDYSIAAVKDLKDTRSKFTNKIHFSRMNLSVKKYFNAGVIYFNLKKIRKEINLFNKSMELLLKYSNDDIFFDQDVLNSLFQNKCLFISKTFNFMPVALEPNKIDINLSAIIHYAGPKPWKLCCSQFDWLYWKYFSFTPWGDSVEKLLAVQCDVGIDLGYALFVGKIGSRRMLLKGLIYDLKKIFW